MRFPIDRYWPGIILAALVILTHSGIIYAVYSERLPTLIAIMLLAGTYHLAYTAFHEAVHGLLGKGLSPALGVMLGQIMGVSFAAHNYLHNKSHHSSAIRTANTPDKDSLVSPFLQVLITQYLNIFLKGGRRKIAILALYELAFIIGLRLVLIGHAQSHELTFVLILTPILGAWMIYLVFDRLVHQPSAKGRLTITHIFPSFIHKFLSYLMAFQNYHVVHHIEPDIPFHLYPDRFQHLLCQNHLKEHEIKFWSIKAIKLKGHIY